MTGDLDDLAAASTHVAGLLDLLPPDRWTAPTPCTDWSVRDLVDHLVGMDLVLVAVLGQGPRPDRAADRLGDDPAGAYRRSSAALQEVAGRPGVLGASAETPLGTITNAERVRWRVVDLVVHGWDLARATGVDAPPPADLVLACLAFAEAGLPGQPRAGRFADARPVADAAPPLDRLLALTGRDPGWAAPAA